MEFIQGTDLDRLVEQKGPLPVSVACELIRQAALGLEYSFEQGMVHRDIKPSNLMVTTSGTVKILDFGIAKMHSELATDPGLTSTGALLGSVNYMAPEQADEPRRADIRADIYSLGCTFYHLLSGRPPFEGGPVDVLLAHKSVEAVPLNQIRPEVPPDVAALVARMMAKNPAQRFQTPGEVAQALVTLLNAVAAAATSPQPEFQVEPLESFTFADDERSDNALGSLTAKKERRKSRAPLWLALAAAVCATAILVTGWIIYRVVMRKTELVIETQVPNAAVLVTQQGKHVAFIQPEKKNRVQLKPGQYQVAPYPNDRDLRISRETITLNRGDQKALALTRVQLKRYGTGGRPKPWLKMDRQHQRGDWADHRLNAGTYLARTANPDQAIQWLRIAVEAEPNDPDALYNLGVLLSTTESVLRPKRRATDKNVPLSTNEGLDMAISYLREASRLEPLAADIHSALGMILVNRGSGDEAVDELRVATDIQPGDPDHWYNLGVVLKDQKELTGATEALAQALRLHPEMADAYDKLGDILADLGQSTDAAKARAEALRLHVVAATDTNHGIELAQDGKLAEAIATFRKAIRTEPGQVAAHINLGAALESEGDIVAAIAALGEAIRLEPRLAAAHLNLAIVLKAQGDSDAAEKAWRAAKLAGGVDRSRKQWARAAVETRTPPPERVPRLRGPRVRPESAQ